MDRSISNEEFLFLLRDCMPEDSDAEQRGRLADHLQISRPTLNRWLKGLVLPHPAVRRELVVALAKYKEMK